MRNLVIYPNARLREKCREVEPERISDKDTQELMHEMAVVMFKHNGAGLAAPQVGVTLRVIVVRTGEQEYMGFINPQITKTSPEEYIEQEGCLSMPGVKAEILRPVKVSFEALDMAGKEVSFESERFNGRVLQHELEHLDGVLFTDHLDGLTRKMLLKNLEKK